MGHREKKPEFIANMSLQQTIVWSVGASSTTGKRNRFSFVLVV